MKPASLAIVGLDGSRIRANSSRHSTASQKTIEENLKEIDSQIEKIFAEAAQNDSQGQDFFGQASPSRLPAELADLKTRQERLNKALEAVKKKTDKADSKSKRTPSLGNEAMLSIRPTVVRTVRAVSCLISASTKKNSLELFTANNMKNCVKLWISGWQHLPASEYIDSP